MLNSIELFDVLANKYSHIVDNYDYDDLIESYNNHKIGSSLCEDDIRLSDDPFRLCTEEEKVSILQELDIDWATIGLGWL